MWRQVTPNPRRLIASSERGRHQLRREAGREQARPRGRYLDERHQRGHPPGPGGAQGSRHAQDAGLETGKRSFFVLFWEKNICGIVFWCVERGVSLWSAGYAAFISLLLVCCCHLEHGPAVCAAALGAVCLFVVAAFCLARGEGRVVLLFIFYWALFLFEKNKEKRVLFVYESQVIFLVGLL